MNDRENTSSTLVFGASGTQGGPVARLLLQRGRKVTAFVRDPARAVDLRTLGADVAVGDLSSPRSIEEAVASVDSVYLGLSASVPPAELIFHARNVLSVLANAPLRRLVITTSSIIPLQRTGRAAPDARVTLLEMIREKVPQAVVVSPTLYLENFSVALRAAIEQGVIPASDSGDGPRRLHLPRGSRPLRMRGPRERESRWEVLSGRRSGGAYRRRAGEPDLQPPWSLDPLRPVDRRRDGARAGTARGSGDRRCRC
jgi:hypothetical protein